MADPICVSANIRTIHVVAPKSDTFLSQWNCIVVNGVEGFRSERMAEARARAGLSYRQLARKLNMSASGVISYEMGRSAPHPGNLVRLAEALGCATTYLAPLPRHPTLAEYRERAGLRIMDIAAILGEPHSSVWRVERGQRRPTNLLATAAAYGVSVEAFEAAWAQTS